MRKLWDWVKNNPNRTMFLLPILLVAGISISHVVSWYSITNPFSWAIYLSIAIEVGAMTALVAATNKIKGGVWFMFGLITLIQMIGNIFFSFKEIDENGQLFKSWVELTGPLWDMIGSDSTDIVSMKRWLAFLEGGLLPIISLTSLHFFVKYETAKTDTTKELLEEIVDELNTEEDQSDDTDNLFQEDVYLPTKQENLKNMDKTLTEESKRVWVKVQELREEDKLPIPTEEDIVDEPTALANSQYRLEELNDEDDYEKPLLVEEENPEDEFDFKKEFIESQTKSIEPESIEPARNLGRELAKNWKKIVRNNSIGKI